MTTTGDDEQDVHPAIAWIPPIMLVAGLLMCALTVPLVYRQHAFNTAALRVEGEVIGLHARETSGRNPGERRRVYCPRIGFVTADGRNVAFIANTCSRPASYDIGERVDVRYLRESPESAELIGLFATWGGAIICGLLGVVFSGVGLLFTRLMRPRTTHRRRRTMRRDSRGDTPPGS